MALAPAAQGGLIDPYALTNFTLQNSNADGSFSLEDNSSLLLIGGNNGSGLPGTTDFTILSIDSVIFTFDYTYSSLDAPGFDDAGYLVDQTFTGLADTDGEFGSAIISVGAGQMFGFRVETPDNMGEPGEITIANFTASAQGSQVPDPGSLSMVLIGIAGITFCRKNGKRMCAAQLHPRNEI